MNRTALAALAILLIAVPVSAEVSVTRDGVGDVELFFEAGPDGPWQQVRSEVLSDDLLNPDGDLQGDGWPQVIVNSATGKPDVVWSAGGDDREIYFSYHDGDAWSEPANLSDATGDDDLPAFVADEWGNRFVVWTRPRTNGRDLVLFTGIAGDDQLQTAVEELSDRSDTARRPTLAIEIDGDVIVAYEERHSGNDATVYLALDRIGLSRDASGYVLHSGNSPIDIARSETIATHAALDAMLKPQAHAEAGSLWVDWVDEPGVLGWVELDGDTFSDPEYVDMDLHGGEQGARDHVREVVLD